MLVGNFSDKAVGQSLVFGGYPNYPSSELACQSALSQALYIEPARRRQRPSRRIQCKRIRIVGVDAAELQPGSAILNGFSGFLLPFRSAFAVGLEA
jgi:hypothetical protein